MKFRILSLSLLALLAACNEESKGPVAESTFATDGAPVTAPVVATKTPPIAVVETRPVKDSTVYDFTAEGSLELSAVNETPSVKHHQMMIHGQAVKFTARAGHFIAKAPTGTPNPDQAAIFYMAYTRDDLPHENRPVTFFWNGGPGSSSFFLHMGSWAPKRLKVGMPIMPEEAKKKKPQSFPLIDNEETLLDQSDLVFVDPVGTGFSQAIAPHQNLEFWGMDVDAKVLRDFITRYINKNNRQSSPKYLYGESYGGIRTPIVANLLEQAGTGNYEPDPSGKKPIVLSGVVLNSPLLDYRTNSGQGADASYAGFLPSFAMTADYYKKATMRGTTSVPEYLVSIKKFIKENYNPARKVWYDPLRVALKHIAVAAAYNAENIEDYFKNNPAAAQEWPSGSGILEYAWDVANEIFQDPDAAAKFVTDFLSAPIETSAHAAVAAAEKHKQSVQNSPWFAYTASPVGAAFIKDMTRITGLEIDWANKFELSEDSFVKLIMPDSSLNPYDARLNIPKGAYDVSIYEDDGFKTGVDTILRGTFDYHATSSYMATSDPAFDNWKYDRDAAMAYYKSSIPDLIEALAYDPTVKMLVLHGYYDLVCPFHQTELDLINVGLAGRIPVKSFEGGHMTYESEEARVPLKQELDKFYGGAPSVLASQ